MLNTDGDKELYDTTHNDMDLCVCVCVYGA